MQCDNDEVLNTRVLRKAATSGFPDIQVCTPPTSLPIVLGVTLTPSLVHTVSHVKLQLCEVYADGLYGGIPRDQALQYIRHMVATSAPMMSSQIFKLQFDMTHAMR